MAITKEKKKNIITDLEKVLTKSKSVVFVNFHKLLVKDASAMRRALKSENIGYVVAKKSLLKKVLDSAKVKGQVPTLSGELAIAFLSADLLGKASVASGASANEDGDALAPARGVYDFQKKLDGKVSILGGIFCGEYKSQSEMLGIASIPSLDVLRGMFVNVINSPVQRFAIALGQIAITKN